VSVLIERYIAGQEFNVGIIELPELHVLPLSEIEFRKTSEMRWPILTYSGKWISGSAADRATPVCCPAKVDPELSRQIIAAATEAYRLTGCRDYARVDLRVDQQGNIFVLEVNANPDLSPNAGLARMLNADGIEYSQFVKRLVLAAAGRKAEGKTQKAENRSRSDNPTQVIVRQLASGDREKLLELTRDCGVFCPDEIDVADELLCEAERNGAAGHYQVLVAESANRVVGWACYGRVPMTDATFDLYWVVVSPEAQRRGIGRRLVEVAEVRIRAIGGRWILAETSSTDAYNSTREYYRRCGYRVLSEISDFYRPGDGKITFGKRLSDASIAKTSGHPPASAELD
jgi:ribosomal protein S18 acetylase RimI-like enzyme